MPAIGYLALLDESEVGAATTNPFFLYGAILVRLDRVARLDELLEATRRAAGFPDDVPLKWVSPPASAQVSRDAHAAAKEQVLDSLVADGARLFANLTCGPVAAGAKAGSQAPKYGANAILRALDSHLREVDGRALVLVDQFSGFNTLSYLEEKGSKGLLYPADPSKNRRLDLMGGFGATSARASRISSLVDVPLGAFGYCIEPVNHRQVSAVAPHVMPLVAKDRSGMVWNRGVSLYPQTLKHAGHLPAYNRVHQVLTAHGLRGVPQFHLVTSPAASPTPAPRPTR